MTQEQRFLKIVMGDITPDSYEERDSAQTWYENASHAEIAAAERGEEYTPPEPEKKPESESEKETDSKEDTPEPEPEPEKEPESVISIESIKTEIMTFAVEASDLSDTDKSAKRSKIFDDIATLPASDQDQIQKTVCNVFEISVGAFRTEIKNREKSQQQAKQQSDDDFEVPECKGYTGDGKRIIWTSHEDGTAKQQGRLANEVFDALCEENKDDPFIFDDDGWFVVRDGTERKSIVTSDEFRPILADTFDWMRVVKSKEGYTKRPVPEVPIAVSKSVEYHKDRHVRIPRLKRVVNRPVILSNGNLVTERGYIPELHAYLLNDHDIQLMTSVDKARETLTAPFKHFPFADDKDHACAFAYLFTLLMREWVGDLVPFFHFGSARQGTGKGLLCDALYRIVEGYPLKASRYHRDEAALERSISSSLLQGTPGILLDNLKDSMNVSNPYLEQLGTSTVMTAKMLYQTMETTVTVTAVTAFTGNNLSFDGGLRRRVQTCRLESDVEFPERREGLPNLRSYVDEYRIDLLSAALTIVKAWYDRGCPTQSINLGSYEKWSNVIAGVLDTAGIEGFDPISREMSDRDVARREFIRFVWNEFGDDTWGAKETLWIASNGTEEQEGEGILSDLLTGDSRHYSARLGYILRGFAGQVFDYEDDNLTLRVERVDGVSPVKYRIISQGSVVDKVPF